MISRKSRSDKSLISQRISMRFDSTQIWNWPLKAFIHAAFQGSTCFREAGAGGSNPLTPTIKSMTYVTPRPTQLGEIYHTFIIVVVPPTYLYIGAV